MNLLIVFGMLGFVVRERFVKTGFPLQAGRFKSSVRGGMAVYAAVHDRMSVKTLGYTGRTKFTRMKTKVDMHLHLSPAYVGG